MTRLRCLLLPLAAMLVPMTHQAEDPPPQIVVAEGEAFTVTAPGAGGAGWTLTPQDHSLASHTYGGMWVTHGAVLGASPSNTGSVAEQQVQIPAAGAYRVWSKYQAPPYFNYQHRIEVLQGGQVVYSHDYGKPGTPRLWSFSGQSDELWWFWGVDHDAAEAPADKPATLQAGPATIRLTTLANPAPAGDRCVDFVVLTTQMADTYDGFKPYKVGTPFANEALAATRLYMRFRNPTDAPGLLHVTRQNHFQPNYWQARATFPDAPVPAGEWSPWFNVGPFLRLVHNEALWLTLKGADRVDVELAHDPDGGRPAGGGAVAAGEALYFPIDITWNAASKARPRAELIAEATAAAKSWPTWNGGRKPQKFAFFGAFRGPDSVIAFKDALGYNTVLPDAYDHLKVDGYHQHASSEAAVRKLAEQRQDPSTMRVVSFGDEIHLGHVNRKDPTMQEAFVAWLQERGLTAEQLGMKPQDASLLEAANHPRLAWYATIFDEEQQFKRFKNMTQVAKEVFGQQVLTGANYSPHLPPQYYGPIGQWIDIFRHDGMSMYWSEDYVFSVPEPPQIASWQLAMARAAVRHNGQPIHWYVMPHAPGQPAEMLYRCMLFAAGNGAAHIDSFWVGAQEDFTENYVAWQYMDSFKAIHDSIYQTAEVEDIIVGGTVRPAKVAIVISKATQVNEDNARFSADRDPFTARSANAAKDNAQWLKQNLCRKDQQAIYLALRQRQIAVDLITEDDIYLRGVLPQYQVVYFAGEWVDTQIIEPLARWVEAGGTLVASAGLGHLNQFGEDEGGMLDLLGVGRTPIRKDLLLVRPLLELPLADWVGTIAGRDGELPMVGWKQVLTPTTAQPAHEWQGGGAAVTSRALGQGRAIAIGGLPGVSWLKTGLQPVPFARGGYLHLYSPTPSDPYAIFTAPLDAVAAQVILVPGPVKMAVVPGAIDAIEATVIDSTVGTLLTLVNWKLTPAGVIQVRVATPQKPTGIRSVVGKKDLEFTYADGYAQFVLDLDAADYIVIK